MERAKKREARFPAFQKRLRELQGELSNTAFADFLGMSRQTVGFYLNGDRVPDILGLKQIAQKCNVSADWLLGLSSVKTPEIDTRSICEKTGLSEKLIGRLLETKDEEINENGDFYSFFDELFTAPGASFGQVLRALFNYKSALEAVYFRGKLTLSFFHEEMEKAGLKYGEEISDDVADKIWDTVSEREKIEFNGILSDPQYKVRVREFIAAQNYVDAELFKKDNPLRKTIGILEETFVADIYKNNVVQYLMMTLNEFEEEYDYCSIKNADEENKQ